MFSHVLLHSIVKLFLCRHPFGNSFRRLPPIRGMAAASAITNEPLLFNISAAEKTIKILQWSKGSALWGVSGVSVGTIM